MKITNFNKSHQGTCTISEISGVQGEKAEAIIKEAALEYQKYKCMVFIYTISNAHKIGEELRSLIIKTKLGRVVKQKPYVNTRYGNGTKISLYLWFVDHSGIEAYLETIKEPEKAK